MTISSAYEKTELLALAERAIGGALALGEVAVHLLEVSEPSSERLEFAEVVLAKAASLVEKARTKRYRAIHEYP